MKEYWFHIDDARTAKECAGRDEEWQAFVKKLPGQITITREQLREAFMKVTDDTTYQWDLFERDLFGDEVK